MEESLWEAMAAASVPTEELELVAEWFGIEFDPKLSDIEKREFIREKARQIIRSQVEAGKNLGKVIDGCINFLDSHGLGK